MIDPSRSESENQKLLDRINQTGFPLQIALEALVNGTPSAGWKVKYTEHAWKNSDDAQEGFIDLVLENEAGTVALVLECKRTLETSWLFLMPDPKQMDRRHTKTWVTWSGKTPFFGWQDIALDPRTPQSQFCVVPGQDPRSMPMIERIGAEVVSATEALAREERDIVNRSKGNVRIYCSVIVTTAELRVCQFDPNIIPLDVAKIPQGEFTAVPAVRFRKQLSTRKPQLQLGRNEDPRALIRLKEHTVFTVNAQHLMDFLATFDIDSDTMRFLDVT